MRKITVLTIAVIILLSFFYKRTFAEIEAGTFSVGPSAGW